MIFLKIWNIFLWIRIWKYENFIFSWIKETFKEIFWYRKYNSFFEIAKVNNAYSKQRELTWLIKIRKTLKVDSKRTSYSQSCLTASISSTPWDLSCSPETLGSSNIYSDPRPTTLFFEKIHSTLFSSSINQNVLKILYDLSKASYDFLWYYIQIYVFGEWNWWCVLEWKIKTFFY